MFSNACEYGIKATIYICQQSREGRRVSLKVVAKATDSPVAFMAKVLQSLAKTGLLSSIKGPTGGYEFPKSKITLFQIVEAIDGNNIHSKCGLGLKQCNARKPCPIHYKFKVIRDELEAMLKTTTIEELANGLHAGTVFLKR